MRHDLTSGAWIEIKPVQDLKGKDQDRYHKAVRLMLPRKADGELDVALGVATGMDVHLVKRIAVIACFVTAWSWLTDGGDPLPVPELTDTGVICQDSVGDYPLDDATELDAVLRAYTVKLDRPDPKEATTSASNGRSKAKASSSLTD